MGRILTVVQSWSTRHAPWNLATTRDRVDSAVADLQVADMVEAAITIVAVALHTADLAINLT